MSRSLFSSRGTVFDAGVLAANLTAVPLLGSLVRQGGAPAGALLIAAWGALAAGAFLKRVPLQERLVATRDRRAAAPTWALVAAFVLLVMLWGLGSALLVGGGEELRGGLGKTAAGMTAVVAVALGWLPAALFGAALVPVGVARTSPWRARRACETAADLLLGAGAVIALAWWDAAFVPELAAGRPANAALGLLLAALATVPFAIFYFAPRLLFLVEDYREPSAWLGSLLAVSPLAWRLVA